MRDPASPPAPLTRRRLLGGIAALGGSAAASPLLAPVTFAAAPGEGRLVVIILRGALDGLDAVRPHGDPAFAGLRPQLGADGPDLDGFFALHPALEPLVPLWQAGEFGVVHAVSTPYRDKRSHFDGQDLLEAGTGPDVALPRDGWLNRLIGLTPGTDAETAWAVGRENPLILRGDAPVSAWAPAQRLDLTAQSRRLLESVYHDDPLFHDAAAEALDLAARLDMSLPDPGYGAAMKAMRASTARAAPPPTLARFAAERLRGAARIAAFSLPGWDTHNRQNTALPNRLKGLAETLLALREELGPAWAQTAVLMVTEFGRTARENGSAGTDHGTGGAMLLAGGAIRGGRVLGAWPGLAEADLYQRRDLMPTGDVRAYAAWTLRGLFGTGRDALERAVFPGLDMGADPGILA